MEPRSELNLDDLLEIIRRGRAGKVGDIDYQIGADGINGEMKSGDATIRALLGYDGKWALGMDRPMWGGNMSLDASKPEGKEKQLMLKYRKAF